ncbi:22020_t:CDS:1, partial [Rhizophagus irregularis]
KLICIESVVEQQEICPFLKFNTEELKQAARILDKFYFYLKETLNRFIYFVNKNHKSENLIKVLIWKKNIAAIRRYFANNIVSELNQMSWDLTPFMINILFKREPFFTQ